MSQNHCLDGGECGDYCGYDFVHDQIFRALFEIGEWIQYEVVFNGTVGTRAGSDLNQSSYKQKKAVRKGFFINPVLLCHTCCHRAVMFFLNIEQHPGFNIVTMDKYK